MLNFDNAFMLYALRHSSPMTGRELLQALMDRENSNPTKLQRELRAKGLQSALSRYLKGEIAEPRLRTMQPLLKRYGIEFADILDNNRATAAARRLDLSERNTVSTPPPPAYLADRRRSSGIPQLVLDLGVELCKLDEPTRNKMRSHLMALVDEPENADLISALAARTLAAPGNGRPQAPQVPRSTL
jgi:transcriptional regulator with XRE-family HTH domain